MDGCPPPQQYAPHGWCYTDMNPLGRLIYKKCRRRGSLTGRIYDMLSLFPRVKETNFRFAFIALYYLVIVASTTAVIAYPAKPRIVEKGNVTLVVFPPCKPRDMSDLAQEMGEDFDRKRMALTEAEVKFLNEDIIDFEESEENAVNEADLFQEMSENSYNVDNKVDNPYVNMVGNSQFDGEPTLRTLRQPRSVRAKAIEPSEDLFHRPLYRPRTKRKKSYRQKFKQLLKKIERKQSKKQRRLTGSDHDFHPPWECRLDKVWRKTGEGFFPPYILDGRCQSNTCMYNLYDCVPQKYAIKVLKRDPNRCSQRSSQTEGVSYEEAWIVKRYHVTVGCSCSRLDRGAHTGT